jgi:putative nucleotidyltransferase with HDIG domain
MAADGAGGAAQADTAALADAAAWAARAPEVPSEWFVRPSILHGVSHTQRVHVHAQRLTSELGWAQHDSQLVLTAALWHDIGRTDDGVDSSHGARSAARAVQLGLPDALAPDDADVILFAIVWHCLPDERAGAAARRLAEPERALRILWLLKDADALDRVRLMPWEAADPAQLRFPHDAESTEFAGRLFAVIR